MLLPELRRAHLDPPEMERATVRALLLDIEGTTTPVDFVYRVLFPYARERVKEFLEQHQTDREVLADMERLREMNDAHARQGLKPPAWGQPAGRSDVECVVQYVHWLMDRDDKSTALKSLQGRIWEEGYRSGKLRGQVYPDVRPALLRWREQQKGICIFSSGSVLAQKLLFANSTEGDLTPFIQQYFDTTIGPKKEVESYRRIASAMKQAAPEILFLSDVAAELDAARQTGMQTGLCVRASAPLPVVSTHRTFRSFDEIVL